MHLFKKTNARKMRLIERALPHRNFYDNFKIGLFCKTAKIVANRIMFREF